jgi:hypothetical protein
MLNFYVHRLHCRLMCAGHLVRLLAVGACGARLSVTPIVHPAMFCPSPGRQCRCRMCVCDPQLGATFIYLSIYLFRTMCSSDNKQIDFISNYIRSMRVRVRGIR